LNVGPKSRRRRNTRRSQARRGPHNPTQALPQIPNQTGKSPVADRISCKDLPWSVVDRLPGCRAIVGRREPNRMRLGMTSDVESATRKRWHVLSGAIVCVVIYAVTVLVVRNLFWR
jgi:hypothetical protein